MLVSLGPTFVEQDGGYIGPVARATNNVSPRCLVTFGVVSDIARALNSIDRDAHSIPRKLFT